LSEVLQLPVDGSNPRRLGVPEAVFDPATATAVERRIAAVRAEALAEGEAAGRAAARAEGERLRQVVASTSAAIREELAADRAQMLAVHLELARRVAEAVLDRCPCPEADALLDRVRAAVALVDADPLDVRVHPEHHAPLQDLDVDGIAWIADPSLQPGEARIDGRTCGVDLRRAALVDAALQLLTEGTS
jgi:flagellar biosynthesis/type III secretory pathway protein FliH